MNKATNSNRHTSALIDNLLRFVATGGAITVGLASPQAFEAIDKPLHKLLNKLDARDRRRKLSETVAYMRRQGYLAGDYEHGIKVTNKALNRLRKVSFDDLRVTSPKHWNGSWHLVFFDIPQTKSYIRSQFTQKLRLLGFQPLQQSIWIHPFACKDVIAIVSSYYGITQWITYTETSHIDHEQKLKKRFSHLIENT